MRDVPSSGYSESLGPRCDSLSISHLLSLQTSLLDELFYYKRVVRRQKAYIAELEQQLGRHHKQAPRQPKNRRPAARSIPDRPVSQRQSPEKKGHPQDVLAEKMAKRNKGKKGNSRKLSSGSHPPHPSSLRHWRKVSIRSPPPLSNSPVKSAPEVKPVNPPPPPVCHPNPFAVLNEVEEEDLHQVKLPSLQPDDDVQAPLTNHDKDDESKTCSSPFYFRPSKRSIEDFIDHTEIIHTVPVAKCSTRRIRMISPMLEQNKEALRREAEEKGVPIEQLDPSSDQYLSVPWHLNIYQKPEQDDPGTST